MAAELSVRFDPTNEFQFVLRDAQVVAQGPAASWLDEQFLSLGAEPLRASGKVLLADKVLAVAKAAGPARFGDAQWGREFAANAIGALMRDFVHIEVDSMSITY